MSAPVSPPDDPPHASRRHWLAATAALCLSPRAARAQAEYPNRPIRLVVPVAPGGSADLLGRLIGNHLSASFQQPVVIENRAGAGGLIGAQHVARAPADGYTLVVSGIGTHVIAPLQSPQSFDTMKDCTHIALLGGPPVALVVNAEQPIRDVAGFIRFVAASPTGLSWGSPGQGVLSHLIGELFRAATGLAMVHISYRGGGPAVADLVANQIPAAFVTLSSANAHVKSGKLRLLALTSARRLADYPDAPTFAELGFPSLTSTSWFSISGPAGVPAPIVEKLNGEIRRGLKTPAVRQQLELESMEAFDLDAAAFTRFVAAEVARWTPLVRSLPAAPR